jgi:hypothetical protein
MIVRPIRQRSRWPHYKRNSAAKIAARTIAMDPERKAKRDARYDARKARR